MKNQVNFWIKTSLFNLFAAACLGVLMRVKIVFDFPFFSQKYLQHAHSHFAFSGWISQILMVLLILFLEKQRPELSFKKYTYCLIINLICAYGMLVTFTIQGYGLFSILFSTASVFLFFYFAFVFYRDIRRLENPAVNWFKAALIFGILSSLGTFILAYMMATKNAPQHLYLSSIYFYLHFQYNGWFFFACLGLLFAELKYLIPTYRADRQLFILFTISCFPSYLLSVLWADLPSWLYWTAVLGALLQLIAWYKCLLIFKKYRPEIQKKLPVLGQILFSVFLMTVSLKLLLQAASVIPAISKTAFEFRPIVIAYLHLVLLAVVSVFITAYLYSFSLFKINRLTARALIVFISGVLITELILAVQGLASIYYLPIPFVNEMLLFFAVFMWAGTGLLFISQQKIRSL